MADTNKETSATYDPATEVVRKKYDSENIVRREYTQGKGTYDAEYYKNHKEYFSQKHERYYKETYKRVPFDVPRDWYNTLIDVIDSLDTNTSVNGFIRNAVEYYVENELNKDNYKLYNIKKALIKKNGLVCSKCNKEFSSSNELFVDQNDSILICKDCI